MKKLLFIISMIPVLVLAQSTNQNYVKTTTYREAGATLPVSQVTYFDGLGNPIQQIANAQSNSGKDIVTHIEYDAFGRQTKEYLPFPSTQNTMSYISGVTAQQNTVSHYQGLYGDANPYSEKLLENSPLNRVFKQAAPGTAWAMGSGHEIKMGYQTNAEGEIKYFKASAAWNAGSGLYDISISNPGSYPANQLYKTVTKDENWTSGDNNTTQEFKDKDGKVVLKRTFNDGVYNTYYVYDQYGNLTYVLPPLAESGFTTTILDGLCYQYQYDYRNRLAAKKLPGKQWEYIVYDKLDRPVATGPVNSPWGNGTSGILITEYDAFGRATKTGWRALTMTKASRNGWQNDLIGGSNPFALSTNDMLTQNYYDNYAAYPNTLLTTVDGQTVATNVKGMQTGSWTRVLTTPSGTEREMDFTFYDTRYRPISTYALNHFGGYTIMNHKLDFMGKTLYTVTGHQGFPSNPVLYAIDSFSYSAQDRLTLHRHQINSLPAQLITKNVYDELGQLVSKNVGGEDLNGDLGLQKVNYAYNIRGWLKGINDISNLTQGTDPQDLFAFKLNYQDNATGGSFSVPSLYNGNISETFWKTSSDNVKRKYSYIYDDLNRLTSAVYQKPDLGSPITSSYNEDLAYDKNGNITHLTRTGEYDDEVYQMTIDDLAYSYDPNNPNQLMKVFDSTNNPKGFADDNTGGFADDEDDYKYDANGNMTADTNKGIEDIKYNHLNLPTQIDMNNESIFYIYNALGKKVQKTAPEYEDGVVGMTTKVTNYLAGGFQYKDGILLFFPHAEGYVNVIGNPGNTSNNYNYVFNYTDHLGNVRLSYGVDPQTQVLTVLEESNYYPFGLKHANYNVSQKTYDKNGLGSVVISENVSEYKFKFGGKELQDELGLNMYDYGARLYDPARAGWSNIDPLAENSRRWSPYNYCYNNPMRFTDPDGMQADDWRINYKDKNGKSQTFTFNGKNASDAPKNQFVSDFISAYNYDVGNGGGQSLKAVAENKNITSDVYESSTYSNSENGAINWNPNMGLEGDKGVIMSPATVLEHEGDHVLREATRPNTQKKDIAKPDVDYDNKEEKRVVTGSEQKTARANGEIKANEVTRTNHQGLPVVTNSPTSNTVNKKATYKFHESRKYKNENFSIDYRKYGK